VGVCERKGLMQNERFRVHFKFQNLICLFNFVSKKSVYLTP